MCSKTTTLRAIGACIRGERTVKATAPAKAKKETINLSTDGMRNFSLLDSIKNINQFINVVVAGVAISALKVPERFIKSFAGAKYPDLELQCYDFGGQLVFYPTHQFFLTAHSIYLLVFNLVDSDLIPIHYWLHQATCTLNLV